MKVPKSVIANVKNLLVDFQRHRESVKELERVIPKEQAELVAAILAIDPPDAGGKQKGIVFTGTDGQDVAAFVQQNRPTEYWDPQHLVPWLQKDRARWMACSSRVFDQAKFESEVANGNIPASTVAKFKVTGTTPTPFIRFGKPKKGSIR